MKKVLFAGLLYCLYINFLQAQTITVIDAKTNELLAGVNIISENPRKVAATDENGAVLASGFQKSNLIEFRFIGYETKVLSYQDLVQKDFTVRLKPSSFNLDAVVISATRWSQNKRDVPGKITTIRPEDFEFRSPQTTADMLGMSGDVFIQKSQQGGGSPMIRGFSTNRLLMVVDGVRMNTAIFRGGNIQNVLNVDPFSLESTEILFGPGSVAFGSDAIGAVMNFSTLSLQFNESGDDAVVTSGGASVRAATANSEFSGNVHVKIGSKKWASVTSVSTQNYGDLRMGSNGRDELLSRFIVDRIDGQDVIRDNPNPLMQTPSGFNQINLMQKVGFKPNENWLLSYNFHLSEISEFARVDRLIELRPNGLPRSAVWNYGPQRWYMNHVKAEHNNGGRLYDNMAISFAHQYFEESRIDRNFGANALRNQIERVNAYSANIDFSKRLSEKSSLFYGAEAVVNTVNSTAFATNIVSNERSDFRTRYPNSDWQSYGAFVNYQYKVNDKFTVSTGARYNHFLLNSDFTTQFFDFPFTEASINNGALTGSLGFVYAPNEKNLFSANVSTGFRAPNVDDAGKIFENVGGAITVPNPNLSSEYAYNAEIGYAKIFGEKVKFDVSVFYTYLDNALVRREFAFNGEETLVIDGEPRTVLAIQNSAFAEVFGFQAALEAKLGRGFYIEGRYNLQRGDEELDNGSRSALRHVAPAFALARLGYQKNKVRLEFFAIHNAEVPFRRLAFEEREKFPIYVTDGDGNLFSPSWYTLNIKAQYIINKNANVTVGIENIEDRRFRPYSSGLVAAGRNFTLGFNTRF
ncbi:MAG: TonB-dependent receptor [Luteibaculaceae bacterium]